jgi:uncharacterized protein YfkK (UPF0435 family)
MKETDSTEERRMKLKIIEGSFLKLEELKTQKAEELMYLLDVFDGKITINELLNLDIPFLNQLRDAKIKINNEIRKK